MQCCTRRLISRIIRMGPMIGQNNYSTNGITNIKSTQEQHGNGLICTEWEEAIIKEQRLPDVSFNLMQKDTIDHLHNHQSDKKQQSSMNKAIKSSK